MDLKIKKRNSILAICFAAVFVLFISSTTLFAATVVLKDNSTVEGDITNLFMGSVQVKEYASKKIVKIEKDKIKYIKYSKSEREERKKGTRSTALIVTRMGDIVEGMIIKETDTKITIVDKNTKKEHTVRYRRAKDIEYYEQFIPVKGKDGDSAPKGAFAKKFKPRIGLLPAYSMPSGAVGSVMGPGIGYNGFLDMIIPVFSRSSALQLRAGLMGGYQSYSSTASDRTVSMTLMPFLAYGEFGYKLKMGLKFFANIGAGVTMGSASGTYTDSDESISDSAMDMTAMAGAGVGLEMGSVDVFLAVNYLMAFETINGMFLQPSLGIAYRF